MHNSLAMEIRVVGKEDKVKTLLVETGQIATEMFSMLKTPSHFLAPVLDTREVAKVIVEKIEAGEGGLIRLPVYAKWVPLYALLPSSLQRLVRWASGIDEAVRAPGQGPGSCANLTAEEPSAKNHQMSDNVDEDILLVDSAG